MFGLLAFAALIALMLAVLGRPYPKSWYGRWGNYDR